MMSEPEARPFARHPDYLRTLGISAVVGVGVGVVAMAFLVGLRDGTEWFWPEASSYGTGFLNGEWWMVALLAAAGLVVGVSRRFLATPMSVNMFAELEEGRVDPRHVPGVLVTGFVSLVSGASLGPEAPLATVGGGLGTLAADRAGRDARVESFAAAVPLGALGAGAAIACALMFAAVGRLTTPFAHHTLLLPVMGGAAMGLLALAFPLTLFAGENEFEIALHEAEHLGGWLLLAIALAKLLAVATALSTGFVGGPIFPMLFAGGTIGLCVHAAFPSVPVAIAVSCVMAATPAAFANVPISMLVLVLIVVGGGQVAAPAAIAVVVAFSLTYGLGLFPPTAREEHEPATEPA